MLLFGNKDILHYYIQLYGCVCCVLGLDGLFCVWVLMQGYIRITPEWLWNSIVLLLHHLLAADAWRAGDARGRVSSILVNPFSIGIVQWPFTFSFCYVDISDPPTHTHTSRASSLAGAEEREAECLGIGGCCGRPVGRGSGWPGQTATSDGAVEFHTLSLHSERNAAPRQPNAVKKWVKDTLRRGAMIQSAHSSVHVTIQRSQSCMFMIFQQSKTEKTQFLFLVYLFSNHCLTYSAQFIILSL